MDTVIFAMYLVCMLFMVQNIVGEEEVLNCPLCQGHFELV